MVGYVCLTLKHVLQIISINTVTSLVTSKYLINVHIHLSHCQDIHCSDVCSQECFSLPLLCTVELLLRAASVACNAACCKLTSRKDWYAGFMICNIQGGISLSNYVKERFYLYFCLWRHFFVYLLARGRFTKKLMKLKLQGLSLSCLILNS